MGQDDERDHPCHGGGVGRGEVPLVSLLVLTCARPLFLKLALDAAATQTWKRLEVVVVDDSPQKTSIPYGRYPFAVQRVSLSTPTSIGGKRNAGLREARGGIVVHWDDDDMHHPAQVSTLACPILQNLTDITALTFSSLALLGVQEPVRFFNYAPNRTIRSATGAFLGSLAYRREIATSLTPAGSRGPFAHVSLSEDLHFVERALIQCFRMLPIARPFIVYTRHAAVTNTWRPSDIDARMQPEAEVLATALVESQSFHTSQPHPNPNLHRLPGSSTSLCGAAHACCIRGG